MTLSVKIGNLTLQNPVLLASGTCGTQLKNFTNLSKLGAIITKSITLAPTIGNSPPRIAETPSGMLNSIGLENPGVDNFIVQNLSEWLTPGIPVIASIAGNTIEEYIKVIEKLEPTEVAGFEINISCPNVQEGIEFCKFPQSTQKLVKTIRRSTAKPIIIKLSPNVGSLEPIVIAVQSEGADAISLINTVYGMKVELESRKATLGNIIGGLSGPCIKPIALYYVYKASQVCKIPIIGIGGIMNAKDALEFIVTGATAVEIGTATIVNPNAGVEIVDGILNYCEQNNIEDIQKLIGCREF